MRSLIQKGFQRSRRADRIGMALLILLMATLLIAVIVGIRGLGSA